MSSSKGKKGFWLRSIISVVLLTGLVWGFGNVRDLGAAIVKFAPLYIILVVAVNTIDRALMTYKWTFLLDGRGMHLPFFRGMQIYCASMVWGMFLPSTVGADAIRAVSASRGGLDSNEVVASILIERMIGFFSSLVLGMLSLILLAQFGSVDDRFRWAWWIGGVLLCGVTIVFAISFSQGVFNLLHDRIFRRIREMRVVRRIRHFHGIYLSYKNNRKDLAKFFGMTFGEQLLPILHSWLIARGLGIEVGMLFFAGAVPLSILISRLPISIDGIGVFEGAFVLLMSLANVSALEAVTIALVGRVLQTISWLPWWMAYVFSAGDLKPPLPAGEKEPV